MYLDFMFWIEMFVSILFVSLFFLSFVLIFKSKKEYRHFFILIALIALFSILDQVFLYINAIFFPNFKDLVEGILITMLAVTTLILAKSFAKLT